MRRDRSRASSCILNDQIVTVTAFYLPYGSTAHTRKSNPQNDKREGRPCTHRWVGLLQNYAFQRLPPGNDECTRALERLINDLICPATSPKILSDSPLYVSLFPEARVLAGRWVNKMCMLDVCLGGVGGCVNHRRREPEAYTNRGRNRKKHECWVRITTPFFRLISAHSGHVISISTVYLLPICRS